MDRADTRFHFGVLLPNCPVVSFVPATDTAAFADAVSALLADPDTRSGFAEAARLRACEKHDIQRSVFELEELYHRIRGPGRRAAA